MPAAGGAASVTGGEGPSPSVGGYAAPTGEVVAGPVLAPISHALTSQTDVHAPTSSPAYDERSAHLQAEEGVEAAPMPWVVLSEMAEVIAQAHAPLAPAEPLIVEGMAGAGFANRLLSRVAQALGALGGRGGTARTQLWTSIPLLLSTRRGADLPPAAPALHIGPRLPVPAVAPAAHGHGDVGATGAAQTVTPPFPVIAPASPASHIAPTTVARLADADGGGPRMVPGSIAMPLAVHSAGVTHPAQWMSASLGNLLQSMAMELGGTRPDELLATFSRLQGYDHGELHPPVSMPLSSPYATGALEYGGLYPYYSEAGAGWQPFPPELSSAYAGEYMPPMPPVYAPEPTPASTLGFTEVRTPPPASYRPTGPRYATFSVSEVTPTREPVHTWSVDMGDDVAGPAESSGEAAAWAGVVSSAVEGGSRGAGSPALALAGEERSGVAAAPAEGEAPQAQQPDMDQLADQVYSIIRRRLVVERERHW